MRMVAAFAGGSFAVLLIKILLSLIPSWWLMTFGILLLVLKAVVIAALAYFLYSIFKPRRDEDEIVA